MQLAIITTTCGDRTIADRLARELVTQRLAACVQRTPIESTYRWQGNLEQESEIRLEIKTTIDREADVVTYLEQEHPYDVPEILTRRTQSSAAYTAWATQETAPGESP